MLLKVYKFGILRGSRGRAFHNLGTATWKDLSPSVTLVLNVGDASKIPPDDLRLYAPYDFKETKFRLNVCSGYTMDSIPKVKGFLSIYGLV